MSGDFKRFESEGWSERAAGYGDLTGRATSHAFEPLLDLAGVGSGTRMLDVACGTGGLAAAAIARGASATGVDLAEGMLATARTALPEIEFVLADAESLPFADATFGAAIGAFVLNHVPDPERCAAEAARVTSPGGGVAFAVWDRPERARLTSLLGEAAERAGEDRGTGVPDGPDDARFAHDAELTALLRGAGLTEVATATLEVSIPVAGTDDLWDGLMDGTVRTASAVGSLARSGRDRVRAALEDVVADFRRADGTLTVPTVIKLGGGRRPTRAGRDG